MLVGVCALHSYEAAIFSGKALILNTALLQRFHAFLLIVSGLIDQLGYRIAFQFLFEEAQN
jgi:hypothetical protein